MSPGSEEKAVIDAMWDLHKDTIQRLYLLENKTLDKVRDTMARSYNFQAT